MSTQQEPCRTAVLAARLAIEEVAALVSVIEKASDGESVRNWSRSTITNVLYSVEPTERMVLLVQQAQGDSLSFAARLAHWQSDGDQTSIEALRGAAIRSVKGLIQAMKTGP